MERNLITYSSRMIWESDNLQFNVLLFKVQSKSPTSQRLQRSFLQTDNNLLRYSTLTALMERPASYFNRASTPAADGNHFKLQRPNVNTRGRPHQSASRASATCERRQQRIFMAKQALQSQVHSSARERYPLVERERARIVLQDTYNIVVQIVRPA